MATRKRKICPLCGKGHLLPQEKDEIFEYTQGGSKRSIKIPKLPIEVCTACGEAYHGPAAAKKRNLFLARNHGILTAPEIKRIRQLISGSKTKFSKLTGIEEETLTEWEEGKRLPTRAMDQYLRLLVFFPRRTEKALALLKTRPLPV